MCLFILLKNKALLESKYLTFLFHEKQIKVFKD